MKPVSIHIDKLYKNDLPSEDCKISVPFSKGILFEQDLPALRLLDPTSKAACPLQPFPVAFWPDRSIRYLMLYFQADIPGNGKKTLTLVKEEADAPVPTAGGSRILLSSPENEDLLAATNGTLAFSLKNGSASLFENLSACGLSFSADQFEGPVLTVNGEKLPFRIEKWREIPRGGSLSTVLEGDGFYEYEKADKGKLRCTVRLTLNAGKPWIDAESGSIDRIIVLADKGLIHVPASGRVGDTRAIACLSCEVRSKPVSAQIHFRSALAPSAAHASYALKSRILRDHDSGTPLPINAPAFFGTPLHPEIPVVH